MKFKVERGSQKSKPPVQRWKKTKKRISYSKVALYLLIFALYYIECKDDDKKDDDGKKDDDDKKEDEKKPQRLSAFISYWVLNKTISLTISHTILSQPHLQTMWYTDYKSRSKGQGDPVPPPTNKTGTHDPYLRLITVMERGVYFKIFDRVWSELTPRDEVNSVMTKLFELPISNKITAARI